MKWALRWLTWLIAAVPVLYYVGMVLGYAYDFPYMDDYPVVVDFLNRLPGAGTLGEKVALLLEQNNFHRLVLAKLIAWANVGLTGSVDFRVMQYVGLVALLGTSGLLFGSVSYAISPNYGVTIAYFLPVLFLLFQFQGWNIAFWPIVAASNVTAPALALLAFYLANRRREGWAIGVALVALFTNGNGILVLPLLLICWLLQQRWRWAVGTLLVTVPSLLFYFHDYQNPSELSLVTLLSPAKLLHLLALDTAFLGAIVYHPSVAWLPALLGSSTVIWTTYLLWIRYDRANPTLFWLLVFLHLTGLMLALNRIQNDTSIVFASRYRNITALHLAATYLSLVEVLFSGVVPGGVLLRYEKVINKFTQRSGTPPGTTPLNRINWFTGLATLGAVALWAVSNVTYLSKIERFRELKQTDNLLWQRYGQIRACAPQYRPVQGLTQLAKNGYFKPPTPVVTHLQSHRAMNVHNPTPGDSLQYGIDVRRLDEGFLVVSGWAKVAGRKANFNDTLVGVKTVTGWQYYTTLFHQRLDKEDSANDKDTGFTAIIPNTNVPDSLAIFVRSGKYAAVSILKLQLRDWVTLFPKLKLQDTP